MSHRASPIRAFVSLGANLGDRARALGEARARLMATKGIRLVSMSAVVETRPVDVIDQPDFLNQVLGLDTTLGPRGLLEVCLAIERALGRDRTTGPPRGPRTIDLDVLLFGGQTVEEGELTIPHPRLTERPFFLELCRRAGAPCGWLPRPTAARTT